MTDTPTTEELVERVREALAFHESVIKSGEGYTETVVLETSEALTALATLSERLKEEEQRVRDLEADPGRPTVVYAGDELEACEERLEAAKRELVGWKRNTITQQRRAEAAERFMGKDGRNVLSADYEKECAAREAAEAERDRLREDIVRAAAQLPQDPEGALRTLLDDPALADQEWEAHEHVWSLPVGAGVYRCMTCGAEREAVT